MGFWQAALCPLILAGFSTPILANEMETPAAAPTERNIVAVLDPLSQLAAAPDIWSVSRSDAGCYLMSPQRKDSSGLAIGRHPKLGSGLFVLNFGLAVPHANLGEPVGIQAGGHDLKGSGRLVGLRLLFVPLDDAAMQDALKALGATGALWLEIRHTSMVHGGRNVAEAVARYRQDCATATGQTPRS